MMTWEQYFVFKCAGAAASLLVLLVLIVWRFVANEREKKRYFDEAMRKAKR